MWKTEAALRLANLEAHQKAALQKERYLQELNSAAIHNQSVASNQLVSYLKQKQETDALIQRRLQLQQLEQQQQQQQQQKLAYLALASQGAGGQLQSARSNLLASQCLQAGAGAPLPGSTDLLLRQRLAGFGQQQGTLGALAQQQGQLLLNNGGNSNLLGASSVEGQTQNEDIVRPLEVRSGGPSTEQQDNGQQHGNASASADALANREEEETNSGIIVPCRARGMPPDHNSKTAFFVIPNDVKHGQHLFCSYPLCRLCGVKFRYCLVCELPVAKRNFSRRHHHNRIKKGEITPGVAATVFHHSDGEGTDSGSHEEVHNKQQEQELKRQADPDVNDVEPQGFHVSSMTTSANCDEVDEDGSLVATADMFLQILLERNAHEVELSSEDDESEHMERRDCPTPISSNMEDRRIPWDILLTKRPRLVDKESMLTWVQQILAVSDIDSPFESSSENAAKTDEDEIARNEPDIVVSGRVRFDDDGNISVGDDDDDASLSSGSLVLYNAMANARKKLKRS